MKLLFTLAICVTIAFIVYGNSHNANRAPNGLNTNSSNVSGRDRYGLLASDYDRNGWAKVNGRWVSNPRPGATVRFSQGQTTTRVAQGTINHQHINRAAANTIVTSSCPIENTLHLVARDLRAGVDVNRDGLINCIDAAVLFYYHFPNRQNVRIIWNYNPPAMNHLLNSVRINGRWHYVEPQAVRANDRSHCPVQIWGATFDRRHNENWTEHWRRYIVNIPR